jgi:hypothetical protein
VVVGFFQVVLGLMQVAGGMDSVLYFGATPGRPLGTFANSNHFANYLAMALALYVWLAHESLFGARSRPRRFELSRRDAVGAWAAGLLVLVTGILMARSRGALLGGVLTATLALALVLSRGRGGPSVWRGVLPLLVLAPLGAAAILGMDFVMARLSFSEIAASASFRGELTRTTLEGAAAFWPWGAGWGVYGDVYPRFQPPSIAGWASHAHQDYAEMLFEGGIFIALIAGALVYAAAKRALALFRAFKEAVVPRDAIVSAICGLGLLGFLAHSLLEFNMHIPANAILAALLAGVFLKRPATAPHLP